MLDDIVELGIEILGEVLEIIISSKRKKKKKAKASKKKKKQKEPWEYLGQDPWEK